VKVETGSVAAGCLDCLAYYRRMDRAMLRLQYLVAVALAEIEVLQPVVAGFAVEVMARQGQRGHQQQISA